MGKKERTRQRILAAARQLLEDGEADLSMSQIAAAAGVTRQLLYLHFDGRADLLLALSREVDAAARPPEAQERVDDAEDPVSALVEAIALQARIKPRISAVASAIDRLRATDVEAARAWDEREAARLDRVRQVVQRLSDDGLLHDSWTVATAADMVWSLTSLRAWQELVGERGWDPEDWESHTTRLVFGALLA